MAIALHEARLDRLVHHLLGSGARSMLDLGCGPGELWLLGLTGRADRLQVRYGSFEAAEPQFMGFDAAALVEALEHIDPRRLTRAQTARFIAA